MSAALVVEQLGGSVVEQLGGSGVRAREACGIEELPHGLGRCDLDTLRQK
ncbi:hypothetical protein [Sorangium sp. So ce1078]